MSQITENLIFTLQEQLDSVDYSLIGSILAAPYYVAARTLAYILPHIH